MSEIIIPLFWLYRLILPKIHTTHKHTHTHTYWQQSNAAFDIIPFELENDAHLWRSNFSLCVSISISLSLSLTVLFLSISVYNDARVCLLSKTVRFFFAWFRFVAICWCSLMFTRIFVWYCHCWQIEHAF